MKFIFSSLLPPFVALLFLSFHWGVPFCILNKKQTQNMFFMVLPKVGLGKTEFQKQRSLWCIANLLAGSFLLKLCLVVVDSSLFKPLCTHMKARKLVLMWNHHTLFPFQPRCLIIKLEKCHLTKNCTFLPHRHLKLQGYSKIHLLPEVGKNKRPTILKQNKQNKSWQKKIALRQHSKKESTSWIYCYDERRNAQKRVEIGAFILF